MQIRHLSYFSLPTGPGRLLAARSLYDIREIALHEKFAHIFPILFATQRSPTSNQSTNATHRSQWLQTASPPLPLVDLLHFNNKKTTTSPTPNNCSKILSERPDRPTNLSLKRPARPTNLSLASLPSSRRAGDGLRRDNKA